MLYAELFSVYQGHLSSVYTIAYQAAHAKLLSAGGDRMVCSWPMEKNANALAILRLNASVYSLMPVGETQLLVGESEGGIHLVDTEEKAELRYLKKHTSGVFDLKVSPDGAWVASAGADGLICLWQWPDLRLAAEWQLGPHKLRSVDFHPTEPLLAVACGDGSIHLIALHTFKSIAKIEAHSPSCNAVAFHPTKPWLLSGGRDAMLKVWDLAHLSKPVLAIPAHNYAIYSIAFSPDEQWMLTSSRDKTAKLWKAADISFALRIDREKYQGHGNSVNKAIWVAKDSFVTCSDDRLIMQWVISDA